MSTLLRYEEALAAFSMDGKPFLDRILHLPLVAPDRSGEGRRQAIIASQAPAWSNFLVAMKEREEPAKINQQTRFTRLDPVTMNDDVAVDHPLPSAGPMGSVVPLVNAEWADRNGVPRMSEVATVHRRQRIYRDALGAGARK